MLKLVQYLFQVYFAKLSKQVQFSELYSLIFINYIHLLHLYRAIEGRKHDVLKFTRDVTTGNSNLTDAIPSSQIDPELFRG